MPCAWINLVLKLFKNILVENQVEETSMKLLLTTRVCYVQGVPKKMFISKKGEQLTNEHFFWDTWYSSLVWMSNQKFKNIHFI